ncbi:uracil DNA glycosylase [Maudiozyma exigua]|uniref:Uracil-DNA glycosylase n=1 Tax=Maudiozyma exigua TaxID=34358 RepID=A0A9P6WEQ9_MAUEX|nr:uracil DNA glycosylase [Kazachstania exigua]
MTVEKRKRVTIEDFFSKKVKNVSPSKSIVTKSAVTKKEATESTSSSNDTDVKIKSDFVDNLTDMQRNMLQLEIDTMDPTWFNHVSEEFTKPYFLAIKAFLRSEAAKKATIFPPEKDIYSWSRLTPFPKVRVVIIGQDPYHNFNQAHGLAFSVKKPTPAPPSLKNIYKELANNYSDFVVDNKQGDLTNWSKQGVLLLNTALTVRAHNANSHAKCGWNVFTKRVVELLIEDRETNGSNLVFMLWGNNAIKLVEDLMKRHKPKNDNMLVLKSVHPSPLSASRGFFNNNHFKKINEWLSEKGERMIDWSVVPGKYLAEVSNYNSKIE